MKSECKTCDVIRQCKAAFGRFWTDKSRGGVGCTYKFPAEPDDVVAARAQKAMAKAGCAAAVKKPARFATQKKFWCEEVEA